MDRTFQRVITLIGEEQFTKLHNAHVCLVGFGAVGSFAGEALVRSGIGHLRVIDADLYDQSNINRQLGAVQQTVGMPKVAVAAEHFRQINPDIDLETEELFLNTSNQETAIKPFKDGIRPSIIIDAIDTLDAKTKFIQFCVEHAVTVLSSMGAARKTDPSKICFGDISKTEICPLAREVRKRLRKAGIHQGVGCVYSKEEPPSSSHKCTDFQAGARIQRPILGSLVTITGAFGLRLASECLKKIMNEEE